ncbi:threonine--tRNA ligase, mitochondrial 1-like isoform X2 [Mangifera indica]|uniref:threonine--tRNA ligase, mitochondrial 1-like isoform X2 n=1 Tax=Mangifera indica TaxID=29780 RepID=UPI001CFB0B4A|nr:threonine--tRNA ligase, mitochondrial 1-like isoform X2 [Mangifera indica]
MAAPNHPKDEDYLKNVIQKRISLFQSIQSQQQAHMQSLPHDPIRIVLPDGSVKEGKRWQTSPMDIAKEISKSLAANALISMVDGVLWDMNRPLEGNCQLKLVTFESDEGRDTFWHSSAHILGQALEMEYGCKLCIGPCTTRGEGFYYDAFYGDLGLNQDHFKSIDSGAAKAVVEKQPFEHIEVTREQALEIFSDNSFKVEIINDLPADKTITVYRCGPLVDLCRGPHIPNTSFVKAFACLKASSAYWRGNKDRESLQRVYGISFPDKKSLQEHIKLLKEAEQYDHREVGKKQELFFNHPLSPGSWFFLPHGARVYNKLMEFIKKQYWERGYQEVISPNMYNMKLWEISGHAANYKENMFLIDIEKQEFGLKPMNCPGHCLMFDHKVRSYRELPLRLADFGVLHRNEASGALTGLTRVRRFQQDDAHIFCRESQRPEKYLGDLATWEKAEAALTEALNEFGKPWQINEGDGAFYGPKIDISVSDALKRKFQCATLQLDFQLPNRFNLGYSAEDEAKTERPVMIHRAILGSVERMFAILLEHYKGKWPFWLSPRQAIVCPVSEKSQPYALQVRDQIQQEGYYVDADTTDRKIQKKIREAQLAQYNYILVVGEEEAKTGQVSVRERDVKDQKDITVMSMESLLKLFKDKTDAYQ